MLRIRAGGAIHLGNGITRREALQVGAASSLGFFLPSFLRAEAGARLPRRAKSVIILFLNGGPSHLAMWDLKPDALEEIRGTFRPIDTPVSGIRISEHLPRTAAFMHHASLLRSMVHTTGDHPAAAYWMMIGSRLTRHAPQVVTMSHEDRPHPGSVLARYLPSDPRLPVFVMIPEALSLVGPERPGQHAGFLGAAYDPIASTAIPTAPTSTAARSSPPRKRPSNASTTAAHY